MEPNQRPQLVWDLPIRLWHWALVFCLTGSWITAEAGFDWTETHFYFGYCALALVIFRLGWGFAGTLHSRYQSFLVSPRSVTQYLLGQKSATRYLGHNPLGGWASVIIVVVIGLQAGTGLFISDDIFYAGPYNSIISTSTADWLAGWHHRIFTLIQLLVVVHVVAVSWYTWGRKEHLIQAMFHGRKNLSSLAADQTITGHRARRAILLALLAILAVAAGVYFAPLPQYDFY
jgi:cytochrome b